MKMVRVLLAVEAQEQAGIIDNWWRENRPSAPELFVSELSNALSLLAAAPKVGQPFAHPRARGVRRLLLRSTHYHVYYRAQEEAVIVVAIWSSVRGFGPDLSRFGSP
jgi:plasmid stabilization system protein ParE